MLFFFILYFIDLFYAYYDFGIQLLVRCPSVPRKVVNVGRATKRISRMINIWIPQIHNYFLPIEMTSTSATKFQTSFWFSNQWKCGLVLKKNWGRTGFTPAPCWWKRGNRLKHMLHVCVTVTLCTDVCIGFTFVFSPSIVSFLPALSLTGELIHTV